MNRNVFKFLRKKILEHSHISESIEEGIIVYKIESLGSLKEISFPSDYSYKKYAEGLLIDRLVEEPGYLEKLERIETRKDNLKNLLG
jgi:hypothetical protein